MYDLVILQIKYRIWVFLFARMTQARNQHRDEHVAAGAVGKAKPKGAASKANPGSGKLNTEVNGILGCVRL